MSDPVLVCLIASLLLFIVAHLTGVASAYEATDGEVDHKFYGPAVGIPLVAALFFGPILYAMIT